MLTTEQKKLIVISINKRANQILENGGCNKELLMFLSEMMPDVKNILDSSSSYEMNKYY